MKARVIETNEIVELQEDMNSDYSSKDGVHFKGFELDFDIEQTDYWEKLKHQAAITAMQGIINNDRLLIFLCEENMETTISDTITSYAFVIATKLVNKLKEEAQCEK